MPLIDLLRPDQRAALRRLRNPAEVALCTLLDGVEADDTEHDAGARDDQAVPLLDDLSALSDPCLRW